MIKYFLKHLLVLNKLNHLQLIEGNASHKKHFSNSVSKALLHIS